MGAEVCLPLQSSQQTLQATQNARNVLPLQLNPLPPPTGPKSPSSGRAGAPQPTSWGHSGERGRSCFVRVELPASCSPGHLGVMTQDKKPLRSFRPVGGQAQRESWISAQ